MGQVYLAEDVRLGRKLALKVLPPRATPDEARVGRFEREARTISALNHPNIITIYDTGEVRGSRFIATEFIDGVTLRQLLRSGRLEVRQAVAIAVQVVAALTVAHAEGVVHRDLKPENVMVRADGQVKVLDFGLAKLTVLEGVRRESETATHAFETAEGVVMGTFHYMAPEQARGDDTDARADIFAVGVLLYEMLAGAPPFKGPSTADVISALLLQEPEPLLQVPLELERIVLTALSKERTQRYQTCAQLLEELRALLTGDSQPDRPSLGITMAAYRAAGLALDAGTSSIGERPGRGARTVRRKRHRQVVGSVAVLPLVKESPERDLEYPV